MSASGNAAATAQDILTVGQGSEQKAASRRKELDFKASHGLLLGFLFLVIVLQAIGIYLFTSGFLLTRLVLDHKSECDVPPIDLHGPHTPDSVERGCWHPKTYNKAVVLIIDALRYDFTVPFEPSTRDHVAHQYSNGIPILHETAANQPRNAFLRPFIADPPTTTLQRLKGLTTGSLPTFIDAGSNFAGTSIDEDNLITQLTTSGKRVVHLGDDTWHALFPDHFEPNLTKPFDSFNVPDLHTVDNGVITHLFPLLEPGMAGRWDVVIGHFLGVDHVGHNFGPDHPTMTAKLQQMEDVVKRAMGAIDDETLLVVMGDHGMDSKGNHGGESDDEVEAALWMYSKRAVFGRSSEDSAMPPKTAKDRPVGQIDLVPTLALLLGLPIPANNLGIPIEEAFIGTKGDDWQNMASVNRLSAAQAYRFQQKYSTVRSLDEDDLALPLILWDSALRDWDKRLASGKRLSSDEWHGLAGAFASYQQQNLAMFRALWGTFDMISMSMGVTVLLLSLSIIFVFSRRLLGDTSDLHARCSIMGAIALLAGGVIGLAAAAVLPPLGLVRMSAFVGASSSCIAVLWTVFRSGKRMSVPVPKNVLSWFCAVVVVLLAAGFGSNSFTVWEEEQLLFVLAAIGALMLAACLRSLDGAQRVIGVYHAVAFMVMIRLASFARICREEQMPYCTPLFYASATSTTSAGWRLAIPWVIGIVLPTVIKGYYDRTSSYQASAPFWIGIAMRTSLFFIASVWTLDTLSAAGTPVYGLTTETMKLARTYVAQLVLCISVGAGGATFGWQGALIGVEKIEAPPETNGNTISDTSSKSKSNGTVNSATTTSRPQIVVQGTNNLYGSHFAMLPFTIVLLPLLLLSKPMGELSLFATTVAILSLLELLHIAHSSKHVKSAQSLNGDDHQSSTSAVGPTILALLGHFAYFKTGHQAALASIQWDSAFVPLQTIRYPWSPIFVILNSFAGQILCAAAVPALVLWRRPFNFNTVQASGLSTEKQSAAAAKRRSALLSDLAKAQLTHFLVYAVIQLATTVFVAHLRRHLMLYRVFCPRWMLASVGMIVAELAGTVIGVAGVAWTQSAICALFGW